MKNYSASTEEMGSNVDAALITWQNALKHSHDNSTGYILLTNEEEREAFRTMLEREGGWTREDIDKWSDVELNAICLQWVASKIRATLSRIHNRIFFRITDYDDDDGEA